MSIISPDGYPSNSFAGQSFFNCESFQQLSIFAFYKWRKIKINRIKEEVQIDRMQKDKYCDQVMEWNSWFYLNGRKLFLNSVVAIIFQWLISTSKICSNEHSLIALIWKKVHCKPPAVFWQCTFGSIVHCSNPVDSCLDECTKHVESMKDALFTLANVSVLGRSCYLSSIDCRACR